MQDIFEQVDAQLDAERVQKFWEQNQKFVIGGIILLFLSAFGYVGWQDYQLQRDQSAAEQFVRAQALFDQKKGEESQKQFVWLQAQYSGHGYAFFGRFLLAKQLADEGKTDLAIAQLEQLATDAPLPILVDLTLLNAAYLTTGDAGRAEGFLARMDKYSPYRAHALELQGLLAAQRGDQQTARTRYREAYAVTPEGTLRSRLESRLEHLSGEEKK